MVWNDLDGLHGNDWHEVWSRKNQVDLSHFDGALDSASFCISLPQTWLQIINGLLFQFHDASILDGTDEQKEDFQAQVDEIQSRLIIKENCGATENECIEYPSSFNMISYSPQNPFTEPDTIPSGFLTPPFTLWSDFFPFISSWLTTYFGTQVTELTGYENDDVIVDISSFPLTATSGEFMSGVVPQIAIDVNGMGVAELHLINIPLGGRAIITVDVQPNLVDIFLGILGNAEMAVELNRDVLSLPMESPAVIIQEIEIDTVGAHTIYITFVPVLDDALIPFNFGGGLRKVVLCGFDEVIMPIVEDVRVTDCGIEKKINNAWIPAGDLTTCVTDITNPLQAQIAGNDNDIAALQATDTNLQGQINANDADILNIQNVNTTQSNDIVALYAENDVQDTDIQTLQNNVVSLQGQITTNLGNINSNDTDIDTLGASLLTTNAQVNTNETDISALQIADTNLQNQITLLQLEDDVLQAHFDVNDNHIAALQAVDSSHDTRITSLENAPASGGSGGGIIPTTYTVQGLTLYRESTATPQTLSDFTQPHTFQIPRALITCTIASSHFPNGGTSFLRMVVNGVLGDTFSTNNLNETATIVMSHVFDSLPVGASVDMEIEMWSAGGNYARVSSGVIALWQVIEYSLPPVILNSPLIDFDNDTPYTPTANNDGLLDASGNPNNCLRVSSGTGSEVIQFEIDLGEAKDITDMTFDWYSDDTSGVVVYVWVDDTNISQYLTMTGTNNTWKSDIMPLIANLNGQVIKIHMAASSPATDFRIDNIQITTA